LAKEAEELYRQAREACSRGKTLEALALVERALTEEPEHQGFLSLYGLCIARERGQTKKAIEICEKAVAADPKNIDTHIHLGKVYYAAGFTEKAIEAYRKGLTVQRDNPELIAELEKLGPRREPVIPFLVRKNFVNRYLGILLKKIGSRQYFQ
jgi:tetratricopeptide (TPR) repeat protein